MVKIKFGKVSRSLKFHAHDCLQNFILFFMFSLTAPIVKNSHILAEIYVILLKNVLAQT